MRRTHAREAAVAIAILALGAVLAVLRPQYFSAGNLNDLFLATLPVLIVSAGMMLVILTGEIDISVGSTFAVCAVAGGLLATAGVPTPAVLLAVSLCGAAIGAANGALVAYLGLPSIVVTLAAMIALRDLLRWATEGAWVHDLPATFQWMGLSQAQYPLAAVGMVTALLAALGWMLRATAGGRQFYATGSSPENARLAGIDTPAVKLAAFVGLGALTGLASIVNAMRFNQIPSNTGLGLELEVIAAVVVGGTAITGGRGSLFGTVLGVLLLGAIGPALTFLGVSAYWERAIQGAIILVAIATDALPARPVPSRQPLHAARS